MTPPRPALAPRICARIDELAAISADTGVITRVFMSPEQRQASDLTLGWMREAGMAARIDAIGNIVGRYEGAAPGQPALLLGSHLDTVRDAGRWDGMLGVATAIECVAQLNAEGVRLPFAIEVVGFSDEEGTRFGATMLGSRALAGAFEPALLALEDGDGVTMAAAIRAFGLDPGRIGDARRAPEELLAYAELHIEQGPVLQAESLAVGCVTSICGATRLNVTLTGTAGHAGTVPMGARADALAGAAACILEVERTAGATPGLVATVGRIEAAPGAPNVIPGRTIFSVDIRAPDDAVRRAGVAHIQAEIVKIAASRGLRAEVAQVHEEAASACARSLMDQVDAAIGAQGIAPFRLASGAGHDAMVMGRIAPTAMIFVRCRDGISHNPAEHADAADVEIGARTLLHFIRNFKAPPDVHR